MNNKILNPHHPRLPVTHCVHCYLVIQTDKYSSRIRSWLCEYAIPLNWKADSEGWFTEYQNPKEVFQTKPTTFSAANMNECVCTQHRFTTLQAARSLWCHATDNYSNPATGWRVQRVSPAEVMQWWQGELNLRTTNV
jgi:hypothetical protein